MPEPPAIANVDGIVFDLFGTLTDGRLEHRRATLYRQLAAVLGVPTEPFVDLLRQTFHERSVGAFGPVRETLTRLCALLGARVDDATIDAAARLRLGIERE